MGVTQSSVDPNISSSCQSFSIQSSHILVASCASTFSSDTISTSLDLNLCYNNQNGVLTPKDNGGAFDSCTEADITDSSTILSALCPTDDVSIQATVDLSKLVTNNGESLSCLGNDGA